MKVFIYFNLHRKCWSIKALEGENKGRVMAHARSFEAHNVTFKVSEAGRQRVIREQRKNVHAGIVGDLWDFVPVWLQAHKLDKAIEGGAPVSYNPYKGASFFRRDTGDNISRALGVIAVGREVMAYQPE
jgi:hypothetical protein